MTSRTRSLTCAAVVLLLCALILPALPTTLVRAAGTTYYVGQLFPDDTGANTANCAVATNMDCTLRDAIAAATSGMDTIQFYANIGVYTLGTGAGQGTLVLANSVTITGPGPDKVTIDGGLSGATQSLGTVVFAVNSGVSAAISGLEIAHGNNQGIGGGGIYSQGNLTLTNDLIDHNNTNDIGGGVDSQGPLTVTGCTITNNTTIGGGGGIYVGGNTVSITNSTISYNRAGSGGGGGGIFLAVNTGTITNSTILGNVEAGYAGGGIYLFDGKLTITGSTISGNTAAGPGGGGIRHTAFSALTITDSTLSGNTVTGTGNGGGLLEEGLALTLTRVQVTNNTAGGNGGGISTKVPTTITGGTIGSNTASTNGGGIALVAPAALTTTNVMVTNNAAHATASMAGGGGIYVGAGATVNPTVADNGSTFTGNTAVGANSGRGGAIDSESGTLTLTHTAFRNNTAGNTSLPGAGGALFVTGTSATVTSGFFIGNSAGNTGCGGAIEADAGTLTIAMSLFTNNSVAGNRPCGGALAVEGATTTITGSAFTNNTAIGTNYGDGGAIALDSGTLAITGSSFTGNKAGATGMLSNNASGGGAIVDFGGTLNVANSTFFSNQVVGTSPATPVVGGGAVAVTSGSPATFTNDTFSGNTAPIAGGIWQFSGAVNLTDVLVFGSTDGTVANHPVTDLVGAFDPASRNNLIGSTDNTATGITNGANVNQVGTLAAPLNAHLGPLADNGGPTLPDASHPQTLAPLPSSPAIDAGGTCGTDPTTNQPLLADQRGITRPQGNGCDIGAYEYVPVRPTLTGMYTTGTGGGLTLTLTGTGFQHDSVVSVGGTALPASAVTNVTDDGTSLHATLPAHAAGVVTLSIVNPGNLTSATTGNLTYIAPNMQPTAHAAAATTTTKPKPLEPTHPPAPPMGAGTPTPRPQPTRH